MNATTGGRLREERIKLGFSQEKMSELGGVKRLSQTNYETDKRTPDGDYLIKISEIGADVNYILTGVRMLTLAGSQQIKTKEPAKLKMDNSIGEGVNDENMSPKRKLMMELLKRLDDDVLDDAIYATKKLVENCEMKVMLNRLMAQQGGDLKVAA